jgi:thioredoxin 1
MAPSPHQARLTPASPAQPTRKGSNVTATRTLTDASFAADVLANDKPVLVDFWAAWCGPCRMMSPMLEQIAESHQGQLAVGKLNIEENPDTTTTYNVMSVPTMAVFVNGTVVKQIVGAKAKSTLLRELAEFL